MEDLGVLIFLIVTAIFSLIKMLSEKAQQKRIEQRRQEAQAKGGGVAPRPKETERSRPVTPWDEIRKYLEQMTQPPAAPAPSAPPRPAPMPRRRPEPPPAEPAAATEEDEGPTVRRGPVTTLDRRRWATATESEVEAFDHITEEKIDRETEREGSISTFIKELERHDRDAEPEVARPSRRSDERARLFARLRGRSIRDAVVLAELLGPPKGMRAPD